MLIVPLVIDHEDLAQSADEVIAEMRERVGECDLVLATIEGVMKDQIVSFRSLEKYIIPYLT